MDSVAENKRSRESFDANTLAELEEACESGMTSTKEKEKIGALRLKINLSVEKIEAWIGNRRARDKRGGVAPAYSKKKSSARGPSSYTLFSQQFKRESSSKEEHFKAVAQKWGQLTEEDKHKYKTDAQDIRNSQLKGMTEEEAISHHLDEIHKSINILGSLGFQAIMVAAKEHQTPHVVGTNKGLEYIGQQQVLEPFMKAMFGNTVYVSEPTKKGKTDLRTDVRQLLNSCWEKATCDKKPIPYSALLKGKTSCTLEGLPVPMKEPSNYGIGDLKKIKEKKGILDLYTSKPGCASKPASKPECASKCRGHCRVDCFQSNGLKTIHEISDGANKPTSPKIPSELVDGVSSLLGLKQDEEAAIISLGVYKKEHPTTTLYHTTTNEEPTTESEITTNDKPTTSKGEPPTTTGIPITTTNDAKPTTVFNEPRTTWSAFVIWGVFGTIMSCCLFGYFIYHKRKHHSYVPIPDTSDDYPTTVPMVVFNPVYTPSPSPPGPVPFV